VGKTFAMIGEGGRTLETPHFRIHLVTNRVTGAAGEEVPLTPIGSHLVEGLVRNPGHRISQRRVLKDVWRPTYVDQTNSLRQFMGKPRRKLERDPSRPRDFLTEPRTGLRFARVAPEPRAPT
jgi:two-component system KDP operon response regulator KdpE